MQVPSPLPTTYRRLVAKKTGRSFRDVAQIIETPLRMPSEGEVLVKVAYAGVNGGCETFRSRGEYAFGLNKTLDQFNLGAEGAGTVVSIGRGTSDVIQIGSAVTFVGGAFSEYALVKAATCWPINQPTPESVALTISGTVAHAALKYVGKMQSGDTVLVTAAGGATGSFAVQLAMESGCRVIATCGGEEKASRLRSLGVQRVIDHTIEDVGHVLQSEFNKKVDIAYEGVGGTFQRHAWKVLAPGGRLLVVGYISEYPHTMHEQSPESSMGQWDLPASSDIFWKGMTIHGEEGRIVYGNVWPSDRKDTLRAKEELFMMHKLGKIHAWCDTQREFVGIDECCDAVEYMLSGKAIGKVVVRI